MKNIFSLFGGQNNEEQVELNEQELEQVNGAHRDSCYRDDDDYDCDDWDYDHDDDYNPHHHHHHRHHRHHH